MADVEIETDDESEVVVEDKVDEIKVAEKKVVESEVDESKETTEVKLQEENSSSEVVENVAASMSATQSTDGNVTYDYDEKEGVHTYTDKDGAVFFYDVDKKAWFPKVDDDFLAVYQMNYGFIDNTTKVEDEKPKVPVPVVQAQMPESSETSEEDNVGGKKRKAPVAPPKWFEVAPEQNTKVYVSNLPLDITDEEFSELMAKCGMVMKDAKGLLKLKLYREKSGELKGDGLCHYIKIESVELALNVLDGSDVRGKKISVQRAEFQMRGEYNPALKPRVRKNEKEKQKKIQEKLFDWRPEKMRGERAKHERTVIIKNLFEPELFDREVHLILDYQNDLREECVKCGTVRKVTVYDRHPEGVAQISMGDPEEADLLIQLMNGRFFGQRKLVAEAWDGKTKYKIAETEDDKNARLDKWDKYLEDEEAKKELLENAAKKIKLESEAGSSDNNEAAPRCELESIPIDETKTLSVNESLELTDNVTELHSTTDALEDSSME
ncbi:unnamed protein product [Diamesa serratosioi]